MDGLADVLDLGLVKASGRVRLYAVLMLHLVVFWIISTGYC